MWFWTKRQREAKGLLDDAKKREQEMKPGLKELNKIYRENHIYSAILNTLGSPDGYH